MFDKGILTSTLAALAVILGVSLLRIDSAAAAEPLHCEITAETTGGMVAITPAVYAPGQTTGTYQLQLSGGAGGNSANIMQGSGFATGPDGVATLGSLMLGANGIYKVDLHVSAGGQTASCSERIGG